MDIDSAGDMSSNTSTRSVISRLKTTLSARTRTIADFHVILAEPHKPYSPGEILKGTIVVAVVKAVRITHMVMRTHGFVRILKSGAASGPIGGESGTSVGPGRGKKPGEHFGTGFASIFDDEKVLCGEGKLEPQLYKFEFETKLPSTGLPSSIDFEKGTISYMITATITRPTAISPTLTCETKFRVVENLDVGIIREPKPRDLWLEPLTRRARNKGSGKGRRKSPFDEGNPITSENLANVNGPAPGEQPSRPPQSATSSGVSNESVISGSANNIQCDTNQSAPASNRSSAQISTASLAEKTITARLHLLKGGCLPGDNLELRVTVRHTKRIKNLHGIITTLYRQARIDTHPVKDTQSEDAKSARKARHEEYYPKSRTGLGALSLSSAGTSRVFKYELAQTFTPLYVDPKVGNTVTKASVRVPTESFPSVLRSPGQMISFKYYVEVVVDLGGKASGQERYLPRLGLINQPLNYGSGINQSGFDDGQNNILTAFGTSVMDTSAIKRERNVVFQTFEVVVGTVDSVRERKRAEAARLKDAVLAQKQSQDVTPSPLAGEQYPWPLGEEQDPYPQDPSQYAADNHIGYHDHFYDNYGPERPGYYPEGVPPPEPQSLNVQTEKERMQQAERELLPSSPPPLGEISSGREPTALTPSAPIIEEEGHQHLGTHTTDVVEHSYRDPLNFSISSRNGAAHPPTDCPGSQGESPIQETGGPATDDKRELERQRLQTEASAPDEFSEEQQEHTAAVSMDNHPDLQPSAPPIRDDDEYFHGNHQTLHQRPHRENLPRYER